MDNPSSGSVSGVLSFLWSFRYPNFRLENAPIGSLPIEPPLQSFYGVFMLGVIEIVLRHFRNFRDVAELAMLAGVSQYIPHKDCGFKIDSSQILAGASL